MSVHTDVSPKFRRTSTTLADGRELIYFDDSEPYRSGTRHRDVVDGRPLHMGPASGTMRLDALTGDWVSIAGHRQSRTFLPPADECPLCPTGRGTVPSEIPADDYDVVVFENRFPSFAPLSTVAESFAGPLFVEAPALGRCEVVCFTSDHDTSFSSLSPERARTVVDVWADRTRELSALPAVEQVFCFENRGQQIGVTLHHPHGQIYAYPFLPPAPLRCRARPRSTVSVPVACLVPICLPRSWIRLAGRPARAPTGRHTCRMPRGGRSRCTWSPTAMSPIWSHCTCANATSLREVYLDLLRRPTATTKGPTARRSRCPTSPAGTRHRSAGGATSPACTCRSCRFCAHRAA